jgi:hypothetical protein
VSTGKMALTQAYTGFMVYNSRKGKGIFVEEASENIFHQNRFLSASATFSVFPIYLSNFLSKALANLCGYKSMFSYFLHFIFF